VEYESDELQELRSTVRDFLASVCPPHRVRATAESGGVDAPTWRRLVAELGVSGIHLPESRGGAGAGLSGAAVLSEELAAGLAPVPYLGTALASQLLAELPDLSEAGAETLTAIATGGVTASLAIAGSGGWSGVTASTPLEQDPDGRVTGRVDHVPSASSADIIVLLRQQPDAGARIDLVDPKSTGTAVTALPSLDLTRPSGRLELDGAVLRPATARELTDPEVASLLHPARLLVAAEAIGLARACLVSAVEYAKVRTQFDRPIGSFQAVKHALADTHLRVERSRAAVRVALGAPVAERATATHVAKLLATETAVHAATTEIHVHGGTGFTWEHDAHLRYRRAKSLETMFGTLGGQRRALSQLLLTA
jgi:alkylation response protein AidB-like acyl-CoA dehydrogenase